MYVQEIESLKGHDTATDPKCAKAGLCDYLLIKHPGPTTLMAGLVRENTSTAVSPCIGIHGVCTAQGIAR